MDELYDQMVNGGGSYRKLKRGEHYEEVQNQVLANEIRIKERREKYDRERHREGDYGLDPRGKFKISFYRVLHIFWNSYKTRIGSTFKTQPSKFQHQNILESCFDIEILRYVS